jgi:hypothetical protein
VNRRQRRWRRNGQTWLPIRNCLRAGQGPMHGDPSADAYSIPQARNARVRRSLSPGDWR